MARRLVRWTAFRGEDSDKARNAGHAVLSRCVGFDPFTPSDDGMGGLRSMAGLKLLSETTLQFIPGLHREADGMEAMNNGVPADPPSSSAFYRKTRLFAFEDPSCQGTLIGTIECGKGTVETEPGKFRSLYQETWGGKFPVADRFLGPILGYAP